MEHFSYKVGVAYVGVHISRYSKEGLAWATDKWLQVISTIMLFKTIIPLRNSRIKPFYVSIILYALLRTCSLVTYTSCFIIYY